MTIRKATREDITAVIDIYTEVQLSDEKGLSTVGWKRGIYPTEETAENSLSRGDLFVLEDEGHVIGTAIINQSQADVYASGNWQHEASPDNVMVLHTLAISPSAARKGYGRAFVAFYEDYALSHGCRYLRMDTNEKNTAARAVYKKLGYCEVGIAHCNFNGLPETNLVLLEKYLGE